MNDEYVRERLETLVAGPDTADWLDARARARRLRQRRRKLVLAVASLSALVLVAAPAFAVAVGAISFSTSDPAPAEAKLDFAELNTGAPSGMAPGVQAQDARSVMSRLLYDGRRTLWVAPTAEGGFCFTLSGKGGRTTGSSGTCSSTRHHESINLVITQANEQSPVIAFGAVSTGAAAYVQFTHEDGTTTRTDLVWVTAPLNAGFFIAEADSVNQMTAITALSAEGDELARRPIRVGPLPKIQ